MTEPCSALGVYLSAGYFDKLKNIRLGIAWAYRKEVVLKMTREKV